MRGREGPKGSKKKHLTLYCTIMIRSRKEDTIKIEVEERLGKERYEEDELSGRHQELRSNAPRTRLLKD